MGLSTNELLIKINDNDKKARLLAIKRLGMIYDDDDIIDPLLKLLLDGDSRVREASILSLSVQSATPKIINPIINALNDEVIEVQLAAIKALSEFRSISATKPLIKILSDPEDEVRSAAVIALGLIEDKNSLFPLIDCLEDQNPQVRINALIALSQIGDPRAIDPIVEIVQNEEDDIVKQMAILSLGPLGQGDSRIIEPLKKVLNSSKAKHRQYAVVSLGQTKRPEIIEPLLKVMNDANPYVRRACASALSDIKDPATVKEFINRLSDDHAEIRETSARALGKLGDNSAIEPLLEKVDDESADVRESVVNALGELKDSSATKSLVGLFKKEKNVSVTIALINALGKIEGNSEVSTKFLLPNIAIRPLNKAISHTDLTVRSAAAESIAKISLNCKKYLKAKKFYQKASEESLTWEFKQSFYLASSIGCGIIDNISKKKYFDTNKEFEIIYDNLSTASKMVGNQTFISKNYWKILEIYNSLFKTQNKSQFIQKFRDLGLKILLLAKKLPEEKRDLLNEPQDRLNEKFQIIDKRGLPLIESIEEMEKLKSDIFDIGNKIMQIEPLELRMDDEQERTLDLIEDLSITDSDTEITPENEYLREEEKIISRNLTRQENKKFIFEQIDLEADLKIYEGKNVAIGLVQFLHGARRANLVEQDRDLWERYVSRYYDDEIFHKTRILKYTLESIQMRAKPKIIGYLDDAIYENSKMIIFPETSMPESYLSKLQEFADRFNIFIIAGVEILSIKGKYYNRAYIITPFAQSMEFQEKNYRTIIPSSELHRSEWIENIEPTYPPILRIFNSPFGKFIILIGQDIVELSQYIPFISREKILDFVLLLNNGIENEQSAEKHQNLANEISKPVILINTGQFGGTHVYEPGDILTKTILKNEYSEGIFNWNFYITEKETKKEN